MMHLNTMRAAAVVLLTGLAAGPPTVGRAGDLKRIEGLTLHGNEASEPVRESDSFR